MPCELCGGGDMWLKTCVTPYETRLRICDPCYEEHASELVIEIELLSRCSCHSVLGWVEYGDTLHHRRVPSIVCSADLPE